MYSIVRFFLGFSISISLGISPMFITECRYLLSRGKTSLCEKSLAFYHGLEGKEAKEFIKKMKDDKDANNKTFNILTVWKDPLARRGILVGGLVMVAMVMSGVAVINAFAFEILLSTGLNQLQSSIGNIVICTMSVQTWMGYSLVGAICLFNLIFAAGPGPVSLFITGELVGQNSRGAASTWVNVVMSGGLTNLNVKYLESSSTNVQVTYDFGISVTSNTVDYISYSTSVHIVIGLDSCSYITGIGKLSIVLYYSHPNDLKYYDLLSMIPRHHYLDAFIYNWLLLSLTGAQIYPETNVIDPSLPVSNYAPVLQVTSLEGYLPETAEIGTTVRISPNMQSESLQILVHDDDLRPGMPPATYQYILTGIGATVFAVDQRGFVYLNVPNIDADSPNPSTYLLNVQAREVDTNPVRSSKPVTLTIHILDANDNAPLFEHPIYTANTTARGTDRPLVIVKASDIDSGEYGRITYQISQVTNGAEGKFRYDPTTNMLFATGNLIPGERYQVVIDASDGGGLSSQAIVVVLAIDHSLDFSSHAPLPGMETFLPHPFHVTTPQAVNSMEQEETIQTFVTEVSENTPPNTVVVALGGDDSNNQIYFTIVGGNEEEKFVINEQTGTITTVEEFDRERTAMYSLQIDTRSRVPDQHLYWTLVQISVLVGLVQSSTDFRRKEDFYLIYTMKFILGKVVVEDMDADDNGRLELRVAPDMNRLFTVSNNGVVSVNGDFTAEHLGEHRMFIVAKDHGEPPKEAKAEVIVNIFGTHISVATMPPTNEVFEYTNSAEEETPMNPDYYYQSMTTPIPNIGRPHTTFSSFPSPSPIPQPPTALIPAFHTIHLPDFNKMVYYYAFLSISCTGLTLKIIGLIYQRNNLQHFKTTEASLISDLNSSNEQSTSTEMTSSIIEKQSKYRTMSPTIFTKPSIMSQTITYPRVKPRLAPVFNPSQISVAVDENEADIEITKVHASYPDGGQGTISYVLQKGDPSLFSVSSFSGSVVLLRALDAEVDTAYTIQVSTTEASSMTIDPSRPHFVTITVHVADMNDWIPNFESTKYNFAVQEDTIPGTIVGQVTAFDQDKEDPNNRIRYRLISAGGLEQYFSVNSDNGLITLARPVDAFAGEKITLRIEASDSGEPSHSSSTSVLIDVVQSSSQVIPDSGPFSNRPSEEELQFSLRNYTTSVSEAVRPPHLVQILSVNNKPADTRFIICSITSGNYRGAFGVTAGNDGNCELRTQMELDRESVERYLLNVSVTAGSQTDFALVSVTVLDVNDNVPRFIYDNDLGLSLYYAGVSSTAGAFTRIISVKAEDADLGNSSVVNYALDPLSVHSKYFSISPFGEISTKQSMAQVIQKNTLNFFEIRVSACDSPISGQQLCSKADLVINVITEANRFRMITAGLNPQQLRAHEKDMIRSVRQFTGACSLLSIEKMVEHTILDNMARTDIYWYAVNPTTKKICKKHEFKKLFEYSSVAMVAGKVQPWFRLEKVVEDTEEESMTSNIGRAQMLEMPMSEEDLTMKSGSLSGLTQQRGISYRNYGRQHSVAYEGDFSIEENMYAINVPGRMDPVTKFGLLLATPPLTLICKGITLMLFCSKKKDNVKIEDLKKDIELGLTSEEASTRLMKEGLNALSQPPNASVWIKLAKNLFVTGSFAFFQERKSNGIMASFANMIPTTAHVCVFSNILSLPSPIILTNGVFFKDYFFISLRCLVIIIKIIYRVNQEIFDAELCNQDGELIGNKIHQMEGTYEHLLRCAALCSNSEFKVSIHETKDHYVLVMKGAPEKILKACSFVSVNGELKEKDEDFENAFHKVVMVTGDHPITARALAQQVHIIGENEEVVELIEDNQSVQSDEIYGDSGRLKPVNAIVIHGEQLKKLSPITLTSVVTNYSQVVFARTSPAQKLQVVEVYQKSNNIVAVTGDGVNDAPALRKADIGIAMGIAGTDVSKQAADMILLNDNFVSIVTGIEEGRLIFDNLKKSIAYTLTSNIPEITPFMFYVLFGIPLPMSIVAVLMIDLGTDLVLENAVFFPVFLLVLCNSFQWPAISLAYEVPESDIMQRPPRNPHIDKLVNRRLILFSYLHIGVLQAFAGFTTYFGMLEPYFYYNLCENTPLFLAIMMYHGWKPWTLIGIREKWENAFINDLEDSFGQQWTFDARKNLEACCHGGFFFAIVVVQWADLLISKTRKNSIVTQGMENQVLNSSLLFTCFLAMFLTTTPVVSNVLKINGMRPIISLMAEPMDIDLECQSFSALKLEGLSEIIGFDNPTAVIKSGLNSEFSKLVVSITTELQVLYGLEESPSVLNENDDIQNFLYELSAILADLECPYDEISCGPLEMRFDSERKRFILIDFLLKELKSARLFADQELRKQTTKTSDKPLTPFLSTALNTLKVPKPCGTINPLDIITQLQKAVDARLQMCAVRPKLLFRASMDGKKWKVVEEAIQALTQEYRSRNLLLLKRVDVTINSFLWCDRIRKQEDKIRSLFATRRDSMLRFTPVDVAALLGASEDLLRVEQASSNRLRRNTRSKMCPKVMTDQPEDRGGRTTEMTDTYVKECGSCTLFYKYSRMWLLASVGRVVVRVPIKTFLVVPRRELWKTVRQPSTTAAIKCLDKLVITGPDDAVEIAARLTHEEQILLSKALNDLSSKKSQVSSPLSDSQVHALFIVNGLPFIGFGCLDNMIMILAGEYIDQQLESSKARWTTNIARAFGLTVGCIIGMFPLLFFNDNMEEITGNHE
uniref:Cadherin domain-containing protein n=1 Tax=Heterorhabditis bacteriophora TaxID=37862 RepID=A0A1I7XDS2_HETBA